MDGGRPPIAVRRKFRLALLTQRCRAKSLVANEAIEERFAGVNNRQAIWISMGSKHEWPNSFVTKIQDLGWEFAQKIYKTPLFLREVNVLSAMIELDRLTKRFGALIAGDDVTMTVARGEVLGFLGPNGAGK